MFNRYPLLYLPVRNGLLGAVLGCALMTGLFYMGLHPFLIPVYMDFRIILLSGLLVFTLKEFRDYHRQRVLSFWEGMIMSFLLTLTFAFTAFILILTIGTWIPGFVSNYVTLTVAQLKSIPADAIKIIGQA